MAFLMPNIYQYFNDSNGKPLSGGKLYSYKAGTSTPKATYRDQLLSVPNTNPIILNANGACECWLASDEGYKFELFDANDVLQWTEDGIGNAADLISTFGDVYNFAIPNNQNSFADVTSFLIDTASYTSISYEVEILRKSNGIEYRQSGSLKFIYNSTTNTMDCIPDLRGDDCGVEFRAIVSSGSIFKVQLTSTNLSITGYVGNLKFQSRGGM